MSALLCPRCPMCDQPPDDAGAMLAMISGGTQVLCPNEDCTVMMWDGTQLDGGMSDAAVMEEHPNPDVEGGIISRPRDATPEELRRAVADRWAREGRR